MAGFVSSRFMKRTIRFTHPHPDTVKRETNPPPDDLTRLLAAADAGDPHAAAELLPLVYAELRRLAAANLRHEAGHSLNATALVHEAYLRLVGDGDRAWESRRHFFAAPATAMRRILVDAARARNATKRGGGREREPLGDVAAPQPGDDVLALDAALDKLAARDPLKAELVQLRYFAGLTLDQAAAALGLSPSAADRHWAFARAWLRREVEA